MADPRVAGNLTGIKGVNATFIIDASTITYSATAAGGSASVGLAVKLTDDYTIALTTDGCAVLGKLLSVESDGMATVQIAGVMELPSGSGATLTVGAAIVGDLDGSTAGYIRAAASGTAAELILCRGVILANDDTAAVVVWL